MEHYWYIKKWDGTEVRVNPKPETIDYIKKRVQDGGGHIITKTATIAVSDIKEFYESDEVVVQTEKLLASGDVEEDAARAFKEPLITSEDEVKAKAVKKKVPRRKWDSYYSKSPGYHLLDEGDNYVTVGFRLPVHLIDLHIHQECSQDEVARMKR